MSTPETKFQSFGVDPEQQKVVPTLVEQAQEAEKKAKAQEEPGKGALVKDPAEIDKAAAHTSTHFKSYLKEDVEEGKKALTKVLHGDAATETKKETA